MSYEKLYKIKATRTLLSSYFFSWQGAWIFITALHYCFFLSLGSDWTWGHQNIRILFVLRGDRFQMEGAHLRPCFVLLQRLRVSFLWSFVRYVQPIYYPSFSSRSSHHSLYTIKKVRPVYIVLNLVWTPLGNFCDFSGSISTDGKKAIQC